MSADTMVVTARLADAIQQRVGQQKYKIWFQNSTKLSVEDGHLKVGVPNMFIGTWIEQHYSSPITEAVREAVGKPLEVVYTIDPDLFTHLRKGQWDSQAQFIQQQASISPTAAPSSLVGPPPERSLRLALDSFVVGPANQLAYACICEVAQERKTGYHPLFLHGGCGLGKTHLLQGLCNAVRQANSLKWAYVTGEEFTNQFILALQTNKLDAFRSRYRKLDLLVIDDVHFLANKRATQDEFLHTFNAIDAGGKQVVMASDAPPKMIGQLSNSLVNRFVCGMVVRIEPPGLKTRCEILRRRAESMKKTLPAEVINYMAHNIHASVRELEGALLKLVAYASLTKSKITPELATEALDDYMQQTDKIFHTSDIESVVCTFFGLTPAEIHSSKKTHTIALARSIAMYLARQRTDMSYPEIGRFMGNKNHTTAILACRRVEQNLQKNGTVRWQTAAGPKQMKLRYLISKLEDQFAR